MLTTQQINDMSVPSRLLIPPLSADRYEALKKSIQTEEQRVPILRSLRTGRIVDGGTRLKICEELGIEPRFEDQDLTEAQETFFAISLNRDRRQLSSEQMKELAMELRQRNMSQEATAEALGVGQSTIVAWEQASGLDTLPDLRMTIPQDAYFDIYTKVKIEGAVASQVAADYGISGARVSQIIAKIDSDLGSEHTRQKIAARSNEGLPDGIKLLNGSFYGPLGEEVQDASVTLILTDPPYEKDSLPLWKNLGEWASRKLKDGGILAAYCGQMFLYDQMCAVVLGGASSIKYLWNIAVLFDGETKVFRGSFVVNNKFNSVVLFVKGDNPSLSASGIADVMRDFGREERALHIWAKPLDEGKHLVERLSQVDDLVVDPFCGSGTFPLAALQMGRQSIGYEIDEERFKIARGRVAAASAPAHAE